MSEHDRRVDIAEAGFPMAHPGREVSVAGGTRLGSHPIGEIIGRGGAATVVRSGDLALKIYNGEAYRPADFRAEVENLSTLATLGVPHIVPMVDHGVAHIDGDPTKPEIAYLATALAKGGSLKDFLDGRTLDPDEIVNVVIKAAETLTAMHARGYVHGDLKPDNILFLKDPESDSDVASEIWLADLESAGPATEYGGNVMQKASVAYAAPEQFGGKNVPQTDIYELGEVVFEAITGERLWKDGTKIQRVEIMKERRHDAYVEDRLAIIGSEFTPFRSALRRSLKRNLSERYQHAGSFAEDMVLGYEEAKAESASRVQSAGTLFDRSNLANV